MLELREISKSFFNIQALNQVHFSLAKGEVHALIGPNGAGKSTLVKILSGMIQADEGSIQLHGKPVHIDSIYEAEKLGISMLPQEHALVPDLSVAENIFLGNEPSFLGFIPRFQRMKAESKRVMKMLGYPVHPNTLVRELLYSQQSIVAIAKALARKSKILIMDEPTASLTGIEVQNLFEVIRKLKDEGVSIIFITHKVSEIIDICDRVTILRDGKHVLTRKVPGLKETEIVRMMLGVSFDEYYPPILDCPGRPLLEINNFTQKPFFQNVSFTLREGEILGITGLVHSGKSELARALFGGQRGIQGELFWRENKLDYRKLTRSSELHVGIVNQNRNEDGLFMEMAAQNNLTISALDKMNQFGFLNKEKEVNAALDAVFQLDIKVSGLDQMVKFLSGGSQQKITLGKWLVSESDLYLLDEPTRGVDVGSKSEIYSAIHELAASGKGIVLFSSDITEIVRICTRVIVMYQGQVVGELHHSEADEERIMLMSAGVTAK